MLISPMVPHSEWAWAGPIWVQDAPMLGLHGLQTTHRHVFNGLKWDPLTASHNPLVSEKLFRSSLPLHVLRWCLWSSADYQWIWKDFSGVDSQISCPSQVAPQGSLGTLESYVFVVIVFRVLVWRTFKIGCYDTIPNRLPRFVVGWRISIIGGNEVSSVSHYIFFFY